LEHEDEPPKVRSIYEAELAKEGIPIGMAPIQYRQSTAQKKTVVP